MTAQKPRKAAARNPDAVIGERVAHLRNTLGLTLEQLATATGFTKGYLSKIENAKKVPPIGSLSRIARAHRRGVRGTGRERAGEAGPEGSAQD